MVKGRYNGSNLHKALLIDTHSLIYLELPQFIILPFTKLILLMLTKYVAAKKLIELHSMIQTKCNECLLQSLAHLENPI